VHLIYISALNEECEALPGVAYPGVRDNRSTLNTKTGYDDEMKLMHCIYPIISLSLLTAIFPGEPGLAGLIGANNGSGDDNWSYKTCTAAVKLSPLTNQYPNFTGWMPFLSPNQQCLSNEGK